MFKTKGSGSMLEKEYFHKKDRELIERLKSEENVKRDLKERSSHQGKCTDCGHGMRELMIDEAQIMFCDNCHGVHLNLETLDKLNTKHRLKHAISELLIKAKYNQSA